MDEKIIIGQYNPASAEFISLIDMLGKTEIEFNISEKYKGRMRYAYFEVAINKSDKEKVTQIIRNLRKNERKLPSFCPECDSEQIDLEEVFNIFAMGKIKKAKCLSCGYKWLPS